MKIKSIKWILAVMLVIVSSNAWGDNRVVIAPLEHGSITLGNVATTGEQTVTLTVAPDEGYYITASDITVKKTAGVAYSRQWRAPGYASDITVSAAQVDATGKGTYTFTLPEGYGAYVEAAFTACLSITPTVSINGWTYGGTAKTPTVSGNTGNGQVTYTYAAKGSSDFDTAVPVNAGEYTVKATVAAAGHYLGGEATADFTIAKAALTIATLTNASLTYTGSEQTVSVASVKAGELDVPAVEYTVTGDKATNVGDYTATVTANATSTNFTGSATAQWSITAAGAATFTVTVDPSSFVYDGTAKQPAVTVQDGSAVLTENTHYTVAYENNVNAGQATVTVTGQGNYTGEKTATFTIAKAQLTAVTLSQTSLTYTGSEQTVSVSSVKAGELDVPAADYDVTGNVQTAAGTYTVTVTAKAESNYAGSATAQFTITKAAATVTAPTAKTSLVYTAAAQQLVNEGSAQGGQILYSTDGTNYSETAPTATNAGTYTVYYKVTGDANHSDVAAASIEVTIAKAALTTVTLAETSLTYSGSEQTVSVSSVKAGTLDVAATDYDVTGNVQTNVGNYTATVTAKAESNFTGSTTAQWSITAAGTASFTLTLNPTSFVYDGTEKKPAVTVKDGETVLVENTDYTLAYENNVNAGTAKVIATGMGNYSGTKEATFTITKADATVTAPTAKTGLVFNATAQALIEAGSAEGGQMLYSTDGTNYSESVPAKTDAGTYTVYYKVTGDQNHNDVAAASVNVTIAKAALTSVTLSQTSLVYNKTEQTVSAVSVKAGDLTVAAADYDVTGNKQTAAGTYTATVTAKAESNFTGEATAQWTIAAADAATSFTLTLNPETFIYDGTAKQPAVTVKDGSAVLTEGTDYTVAYADNTNVGTATVTVTGKGNYSGTKTAQFTITSGVAVVTTAPEGVADLYYNGEAQTLVSAGAAAGGTMQYSLDGTTWQTTLPTAVNAGAYTVYYKAVGDANHSDSEPAVVSVAIYKAPLTEMTLAQTTLTYNGTEQSVAVSSVKAENLDVTATDYTVSGNKATDVGTYTVTVTANEDGNFTGSATAQWSIVAAGAEAKFTVELEYTTVEYDGTAKEPAVTVKDGSIVLTKDVDYTVAYQNNVNVGTATVVVTGMGNYTGEKTATFTITRTVFAIEAEDAENGEDLAGVTVGVTILDETAKTLRIDDLNVPAAAADEDLAIYIPATLGGYEVTGIADGAITETNVTDIYLPDTEQPLTIGTGALPGTATIHTTLALLDDYALMTTLQQNYEATKVMTTVTPVNKFWTLGTGCDVILPATLNAYTVTTNSETQVSMIAISEADLTIGSERVVKGNNGVLLLGEAGQRYDLVAYSGRISSGTAIATTDNKDYGTDNLLEPVVEKMHYNADDSYFVMSNNEFHAIKAEGNEVKVPAGKAVLHLTSGQAGARAAVLGIVEETTGVNEVIGVKEVNDDSIFDLSGRKVAQPVKGLYIINGKKVVVK